MSELEEQIAEEMGDDEETAPDDEEPEAPEEEVAEEEDEEPATDMAQEEIFKQLASASKSYVTRAGNILGDQATEWVPCPLCSASSALGLVNVHDAGRVPQDVQATVLQYFGVAREADYRQDDETRECPRCGGLGQTRTGSRVPGNEHHKCASCFGYGFVPPPIGHTNGRDAAADNLFPVGEAPEPHTGSDTDPSGEPLLLPDGRENPNFGKWPQFKIPVQPWGATVGLTALDAIT